MGRGFYPQTCTDKTDRDQVEIIHNNIGLHTENKIQSRAMCREPCHYPAALAVLRCQEALAETVWCSGHLNDYGKNKRSCIITLQFRISGVSYPNRVSTSEN